MRKILAASLAAFLMVTASACAKPAQTQALAAPAEAPAQSEPQPQPQSEPTQPVQIEPEVTQIMPDGEAPVDNSDWGWQDEPETIQMDLEEIVSCTYTLPHLALHSEEASAAANETFDALAQTILSYAQQTVYPAAQEKGAIGYVNGGYSISDEAGTLLVEYTLSVSYSTESADQQFKHVYTIDLTTGELLKEE